MTGDRSVGEQLAALAKRITGRAAPLPLVDARPLYPVTRPRESYEFQYTDECGGFEQGRDPAWPARCGSTEHHMPHPVLPTDADIVDHLVHRRPVPPHIAGAVDAMVGALISSDDGPVDAVSAAAPPAADDQDGAPLHVRRYRKHVEQLVDELLTYASRPTPHGIVTAGISLHVALAGMRVAAEQARPEPSATVLHPPAPPSPTELAGMLHVLGDVLAATETLIGAVQRQLGHAHLAALHGAYVAPPGADPFTEIQTVLRNLLAAGSAISNASDEAGQGTAQLRRLALARPASEDQS
jgi:hypothetical protein